MSTPPVSILAIESSCDDTAAAVIQDGRLLSNIVSSQLVHADYGGVVPELASRAHERNIVPVVRRALAAAGVDLDEIGAVAVTTGPGLAGALLVGISFAKAVSAARSIPIVGVNHLEGHLYSVFVDQEGPSFPFLSLVVSGGHTELVRVNGWFDHSVLGRTRDDAAGEAFDKVAKLLGLGYPGGPEIDRLASEGEASFHAFPQADLADCSFSFSGIKTSVLYYLNRLDPIERERVLHRHLPDLCAAFQHAVVSMLTDALRKAIQSTGVHTVAVAGGVSSNSLLRTRTAELCDELDCSLFLPKADFRTDNAAMIGIAGYYRLRRQLVDSYSITAEPSARLETSSGACARTN